jgi:hypothetical protein
MPEQTTGILYCLNCYDTTLPMQPHLAPGSIKRLRVIEAVPAQPGPAGRPAPDGPAASPDPGPRAPLPRIARRLLGEAPVEEDGSFNVEIPADIPVELQVLDDHGMALATCRWIWVKPKENRGCIGCHEDPERVPENRFVLANRRLSNRLTLPPERRRSVGFPEHVMPIIRAKCSAAECHGGGETPLRLGAVGAQAADDAFAAYAALLAVGDTWPGSKEGAIPSGKYIDTGRARTSPLIWRLFGRETRRPWDPERAGKTPEKMPPTDKGTPLTEDEVRTFVEWVDLGAPWETVKTPAPPPSPPGRPSQ